MVAWWHYHSQIFSFCLRPTDPASETEKEGGRGEGQDAGFSWSDFLLPKNELLADIDRFLPAHSERAVTERTRTDEQNLQR